MAMALFYMDEPSKKYFITKHNFYIEQAEKRLLSQFSNIEEEAEKYRDEWQDKAGQNFDPDRHILADFYEQADDEGGEFYLMLKEMHNRTRMSVIAGMFHEWDKQLRSWLANEIRPWNDSNWVKKAVWKANFDNIIDLLEGVGCVIKPKEYYLSLDRCRLVVNAYKHGDGGAFDTLKQKHPEFIDNLGYSDNRYIEDVDYTYLRAEAKHITEFSTAIIEFWRGIPHRITNYDPLSIPTWFTKALEKGQKEKQKRKPND